MCERGALMHLMTKLALYYLSSNLSKRGLSQPSVRKLWNCHLPSVTCDRRNANDVPIFMGDHIPAHVAK